MRLKELRVNRNLLQRDVADVLNCSTTVYCRYEKGEREPPFDIIFRLADYYGVSVDYLLGREESKNDVPKEKTPADKRAEAKTLLESMTDEQYQSALQYLKFLKSQRNNS